MKTVYLNNRSDGAKIYKLLQKLKDNSVVLVVPADSILFKGQDQLDLLAKRAEKLSKQLIIATSSKNGREMSETAGFQVIKGKTKPAPTANTTKGQNPVENLAKKQNTTRSWKVKIPNIAIFSKVGYKLYIVIVALIVVALLAFFILPEAELVIATRSEPVTRDLEIRVDVNQSDINSEDLTIPGNVYQQEITGNKSFTPTGQKNIGKTASGFVQIYNLTKNTFILGSDTTVLRVGGREYRFTQNVGGIRPTAFIGTGEEQEVDQTSLTAPVPVVALGAGEQYNLEPGSRIEIVNEILGSQPEVLYAVVSDPGITGGTTQVVRVITENDVLQGIETVKGGLVDEARKNLQEETETAMLLDPAIVVEVLDESVSKQVGEEADSFDVAVKVSIKALSFDQSDVYEVVTERVKRLLPSNKVLSESDDHVLESRFFIVNLDEGFGILTNHYESRVLYQVSRQEVLDKVKGKDAQEIREILLSQPEIKSVDVEFKPGWVKTVPRISGRVNLTIE